MKKRIFALLTALALCLALLPGAALAEGVEVGTDGTTFEAGKTYVPDENRVVKVWEEDSGEERGNDYLEYDGSTLTVHGQMSLFNLYVAGNATLTGGAGTSLKVRGIMLKDSTLTLDGGAGLTMTGALSTNSSTVVNRLTTTEDYFGDIAIQSGSHGVLLNVQSSKSIAITGVVNDSGPSVKPTDPMTLKSTGDIICTDVMFSYSSVTLEGKNVSLSSSSPVFAGNSLTIKAEKNVTIESRTVTVIGPAGGSASISNETSVDISAGGDVTISSGNVPVQAPYGGTGSLTVKNAQAVNITGKSSETDAFFSVPYTFENCGNVTVTDTGTGELLGEDGAITSDVPVKLEGTKYEGDNASMVYFKGGIWFDRGNAGGTITLPSNPATPPRVWKAGDGWVFWEPPKDGNPSKLTLDNAECPDAIISFRKGEAASVEVKGRNHVYTIRIEYPGSMELNIRDGATLNAFVAEIDEQESLSLTVHGKVETLNGNYYLVGKDPDDPTNQYYLTIPRGTELTISKTFINGNEIPGFFFWDLDTPYLKNEGTIVNNGMVLLTGNAAQGDAAQTIKSLGFTGTGTVVVGEWDWDSGILASAQGTYTNSGLKLLEKVSVLELSTVDRDVTDESKGYQWNAATKTLTLAPGFNADEVNLPDDTVEIVAQGECVIGELLINDSNGAVQTNLTLSGPGPLNIQQHVEICGGTGNSLTVAQGAQVQVTGGFTVGAAGGVDGTITVNGTLTSSGDSTHAAVLTGKLEVGSSGTLRVSGETGVSLGGWSIIGDAGNKDFAGALTVQPGGRFEARCDPAVILASADPADIREDSETEVIVFPNGYLPSDCVLEFTNGKKTLIISGDGTLFTISSDNAPLPPASGHTHQWAQRWSSDATHHWHDCAVPGCPVTEARKKDGYKEHVFDDDQDAVCNVCGYIRSFPEPSEPSEPSGGDSGDNSDGFYPFFPGGGKRANTASVDPAAVWALLAALEEQACPSRAFSDLDAGAWYHEAVDFALWAGLMNGYSDGTFRPGGTVSRAMLAQILYNQAGKPAVTGGKTFSDVAPGAWYAPAVAWAAQRGIVSGYADGTFRPNSGVTREQLAAMLWRSAGSPASSRVLNFTDADRAGDYALPALRWAVERGVMSGKSGGVLDPQGQATRAQTAQMLKNLIMN